LIRTATHDHVARRDHSGDELPPPNWDMYNSLTSALEYCLAAGTLKEDALLLADDFGEVGAGSRRGATGRRLRLEG
jgi:hypothetical protein